MVGVGFGAGWFLRDRRAKGDEDLLVRWNALTNATVHLTTDRLVLVKIEKGHAQELTPIFTARMAEELASARKLLTQWPGSVDAILARFPWASMMWPNVPSAFRIAGEYLERSGSNAEAVQDAKWLVTATTRPVQE